MSYIRVGLFVCLIILTSVMFADFVDYAYEEHTRYDHDEINLLVVANQFESNHYDGEVITEEFVEVIEEVHPSIIVVTVDKDFSKYGEPYRFGRKVKADVVVHGSVNRMFGSIERIEYNVDIIDDDLRHFIVYEPELSRTTETVLKYNIYSNDTMTIIDKFDDDCAELFHELNNENVNNVYQERFGVDEIY